MIFRQLLEPETCTYSYLIACSETQQAVFIDPVAETAQRDIDLIASLNLKLLYTLETHVHADHITAAHTIKKATGCQIAYPDRLQLPCADYGFTEDKSLSVGNFVIHPLYTPGHTDHHHAFLIKTKTHSLVLTGDSLLIDACGRTDFQSGCNKQLYHSIHEKLFTLPNDTLVYPGHDYQGRYVSSIAQEKARNPYCGDNISLQEFIEKMDNLNLDPPKKIKVAVPANMECGSRS